MGKNAGVFVFIIVGAYGSSLLKAFFLFKMEFKSKHFSKRIKDKELDLSKKQKAEDFHLGKGEWVEQENEYRAL